MAEKELQLPPADPMPIDAWIAAVNGEGEAPNGIDEAVYSSILTDNVREFLA